MQASYNGRLRGERLAPLGNGRRWRLRRRDFCTLLVRATGDPDDAEQQQKSVRLDFVLEDHGASMFIAEASCYSRDGFRGTETKAAAIVTELSFDSFA